MAQRLRATFTTPADAEEATRRLRDRGVTPDDIVIDDADDRQHMLVRQQRQDIEGAGQMPVDLVSPAQAKGALRWGLSGLVAGAVVIGAIGLFMNLGDFSRAASIGLFALVGAFAGASAGFVYGGGRQPELDGEMHDPAADTTVGVSPSDVGQAAAAIEVIDSSAAVDAEYETERGDPLADTREGGDKAWKR
jgi:hypothetical protein